MTFWAAGSEPEALRALAEPDGLNPENWGVDFLWITKAGKFVGVQRKTCADLVASLSDGRMGTGLAKHADLDRAILLIEGVWSWGAIRFTQAQLRGVELSVQMNGMVVVHTAGIMDTAVALPQLRAYFDHDTHHSLYTRPKTTTAGRWSTQGSKEWRWHWWQSFAGIGLGQAKKLDEHFGGKIPVKWLVESKDGFKCPGIGAKRLQTLWEAFS